MKSVVEPSIDLQEFGNTRLKILELGCKSCEWTDAQGLLKHFYVGIDYDKNALRAVRGKGNFIFSDLDGSKLPIKNETFDLVIAKAILEHLSDYRKLLLEINRVLKKGGRIYVEVPSERSYYVHDDYEHTGKAWTAKALVTMLQDYGFSVKETVRVAGELKFLTINPQKFLVSCFYYTLLRFGLDFVTGSYVAIAEKIGGYRRTL